MIRFYRTPAFSFTATERIVAAAEAKLNRRLGSLQTESCFYVDMPDCSPLSRAQTILAWLLAETFEPHNFGTVSFLSERKTVLEVGPRLTFETPYSSCAVAICHKCGLLQVRRLERSIRFGLSVSLSEAETEAFLEPLHDRMTQEQYPESRNSFESLALPEPVHIIHLIEEGMPALQRANRELGLAMDEQDLAIWYDLFASQLGRNPTDVELFQIGQTNSEHCRHGWFKGRHIIDGQEMPESPMDIVRATWSANPKGSVIAFADNSSAIAGRSITLAVPTMLEGQAVYHWECGVILHPTLTAETHNHPTGVAPRPGAETGTGGRIRDDEMVGRGGYVMVAGAGYCSSNLLIPGYDLPWEQLCWPHPPNLTSPLDIMIEASNGASFYGNCFGEPVVYGFARTFEQQLSDGHRGWFKPLMYSVGAGAIREEHVSKAPAQEGMFVVLLGGPGYRIGVGGGSASSMISGVNAAALDFASVQRGNPEMENRMDRVVRACINMGENNPILSAHDLGAGGTCNALPEIADPAGARFSLRSIPVGDPTLSIREIWGNESQERNVILVWPDGLQTVLAICEREKCPIAIVGKITGDGNLVVEDESAGSEPVSLPLERVLGKLPRKTFTHISVPTQLCPLELPDKLTVSEALERVLRLPSVASKRWLTNKVDRSVTGLVAQQQCCGPAHLPVADFAIRADSHFSLSGAVMSLGEQPVKGLISPSAMARLAIAEAVLNMSGALISDLDQVKCSANWMWAAKEPGEGPKLYEAAMAAREAMAILGIAIDGGKDSLSMAAKVANPSTGEPEVVKAPGELVVALYAATGDITRKATPDLKQTGNILLWLNLGKEQGHLGGSALAQVYNQIGDDCPDANIHKVRQVFLAVQQLIHRGLVESIHDVSDGGLIVTLLEMAFAGNVGLDISMFCHHSEDPFRVLFAEEPGLVLEINPNHRLFVLNSLPGGLPAVTLGSVGEQGGNIQVVFNHATVLSRSMVELRAIWEQTSNQLERLQANPDCIRQQEQANQITTPPPYCLTFMPGKGDLFSSRPKVAVIREQGTNGDREMAASLMLAGFKVWDVTMQDLIGGAINLDEFRGVVFPGGFAYADVLDSAKGWAGVIRFNLQVAAQFERFRNRPDTFSLGVCDGCQLEALLGWVPGCVIDAVKQPRFVRNVSERFESRFPAVLIEDSPAMMFSGMHGSILGVWVAHGEGLFHLSDKEVERQILTLGLVPLRYVDHTGVPTTTYPFNPNGSPGGVAGLCSEDGRHLAIMPHPERLTLLWQWPWMPKEWQEDLEASPWLRMFTNAYEWCQINQ